MTTSGRGAGFGSVGHLAGRFFGSLWPGGPSATDEAWAAGWLLEAERSLWQAMSGPDRRHAVAVARRVSTLPPPPGPGLYPAGSAAAAVGAGGGGTGFRAVMAAALLHDVGKVDAGLGTWGRAAATAVTVVVGRDRAARGSGRIGRYLRHDIHGADLLESAGSDPLTTAWAREHHLGPARWTVPGPIAAALKAADDD